MDVVRRMLGLTMLPVRRMLFLFFQATSVKATIFGIPVIDFLARREEESRLPRVVAGLEVLNLHSPVWLRRMRKHLRAIVIDEQHTAYVPSQRTCRLDAAELDSESPAEVAIALVHETAHAVIQAAGHSYRPEKRARIERACLRAELRLAIRVGDAELVERISNDFGLVWWDDAQLRAVHDGDWRRLGLPEWLIWLWRLIRPR